MSDYWFAIITSTAITASDLLDPFAQRRKLERRARTYRVLNRNIWWNRAPMWAFEANDDANAADKLLAIL